MANLIDLETRRSLSPWIVDSSNIVNSLIGQTAIDILQSSFLEGTYPKPEQLHPYVNTMLEVIRESGLNFSLLPQKPEIPATFLMKKLHEEDMTQNPRFNTMSSVYEKLYGAPEINLQLDKPEDIDTLTHFLRDKMQNASTNWAFARIPFHKKFPDPLLDPLKLNQLVSNIGWDEEYFGDFEAKKGLPIEAKYFDEDGKTDSILRTLPHFLVDRSRNGDYAPVLNFELRIPKNSYGDKTHSVFRLKFTAPKPLFGKYDWLPDSKPLNSMLEASNSLLQYTYNSSFFDIKYDEGLKITVLESGHPRVLQSLKIFNAAASVEEVNTLYNRLPWRKQRFDDYLENYTATINHSYKRFTPEEYYEIVKNFVTGADLNHIRFWKALDMTGAINLLVPLQASTDHDIKHAIKNILVPDDSDLQLAEILNIYPESLGEDKRKQAEVLYDLGLFLKVNPHIVDSIPDPQKSVIKRILTNFRPGTQRITEALKPLTDGFLPDYSQNQYLSTKEAGLLGAICLFDLAPQRSQFEEYNFYTLPKWGNTYEKREQRMKDMHFMRRALDLAKIAHKENEAKNSWFKKPGPVACVIVNSGGVIIAEAVNIIEDGAEIHAEEIAVKKAYKANGGNLTGCTVYVSYEPCGACGSIFVGRRPEIAGLVYPVDHKAGAETYHNIFSNSEYGENIREDHKSANVNFRLLKGIRAEEAYDFYVREVGWGKTTLMPV